MNIMFFILSLFLLFGEGQNHELEFVQIPPGKFLYSVDNDTLDIDYDYYIMKYEVTNEQFLVFLNEAYKKRIIRVKGNKVYGKYNGDRHWQKGNYPFFYLLPNNRGDDIFQFTGKKFTLSKIKEYANHPVVNVTWFGANAFAELYGLRLPTDKEWEKAARDMQDMKYPWGDELTEACANYFKSSDPYDNGTTPVGFYNGETQDGFKTVNNASLYGCYDMTGNVSEWTGSFSKIYPKFRVFRGGSWYNKKSDVELLLKSEGGPILVTDYLGFRCLKD